MPIWFIFSLFFSIIVTVFAVLNSEVVTIKLFWVNYQLSQSLVILISAVLGATIAVFLGIFSKVKSRLIIRELNNEILVLKQEIVELNNLNSDQKIAETK